MTERFFFAALPPSSPQLPLSLLFGDADLAVMRQVPEKEVCAYVLLIYVLLIYSTSSSSREMLIVFAMELKMASDSPSSI